MNILLKAKSTSSNGSYNVNFKEIDGLLSVWCDCPAGEWGKFCKHKWQLLNGDEKMLVDKTQASELYNINNIAIRRGIDDLYKKVDMLEAKKKDLTKNRKKKNEKIKEILSMNIILSEMEFLETNADLFQIDKKVAYIIYKISKEKLIVEQKLKKGF